MQSGDKLQRLSYLSPDEFDKKIHLLYIVNRTGVRLNLDRFWSTDEGAVS